MTSMDDMRIISRMNCQDCGKKFEPKRAHGRFCSDACRLRWNRRNSRAPHEPAAADRAAAVDLVALARVRQGGAITEGQFAAAAVEIIGRFGSVRNALLALADLAAEKMTAAQAAAEREDA
jgi:hypothetical protein